MRRATLQTRAGSNQGGWGVSSPIEDHTSVVLTWDEALALLKSLARNPARLCLMAPCRSSSSALSTRSWMASAAHSNHRALLPIPEDSEQCVNSQMAPSGTASLTSPAQSCPSTAPCMHAV